MEVYRLFSYFFVIGYLQTRAVYFLMNIHITPRSIYLTRVSFHSNSYLISNFISTHFKEYEANDWFLYELQHWVEMLNPKCSGSKCCSLTLLTLSWRRPSSYRNQSIDLQSKSMDWFLYDNCLRYERVKWRKTSYFCTVNVFRQDHCQKFSSGSPFSILPSLRINSPHMILCIS